MSRRGMHPLLMGLDKPERTAKNNVVEQLDTPWTGLESPQHKRFLRIEAEEGQQADQVQPRAERL